MKAKGIAILGCVLAVFIILLVCLAPFPQNIAIAMHGVEITGNGQIIESHQIDLTLDKNNYLLQEDSYRYVGIELDGTLFDTSSLTNPTVAHFAPTERHPYDRFSFDAFYSPKNDFVSISLCLSPDRDWAAIHINFDDQKDAYYIVSTDTNFDPQDIWDSYSQSMFNLS